MEVCYVGSATTNRIYTRLMKHLFYLKGNSRIASSVKLLGRKNFAFVVIDLFTDKIKDKTNLILLSLEQYYIDSIKPNYNILPLAGNSFGFKHTLETIKYMRDNFSDVRRERIGSLNRGKSLSKNTLELIREATLNRPAMSQESIDKCKTKGRAITVTRLSDGSLVGHFQDIVSAAKQIKCAEKTIRRALKSKGIVKSTYKVIDNV
jgi:group I intron endonuclease